MQCICGKEMIQIGAIIPSTLYYTTIGKCDYPVKQSTMMTLWTCPPNGCTRLYLEGVGFEIHGTWYQAENNERKERL